MQEEEEGRDGNYGFFGSALQKEATTTFPKNSSSCRTTLGFYNSAKFSNIMMCDWFVFA